LLVVASNGWLAERYLFGQWMSADFADYCGGILSSLQDDPELWPTKRSHLAGWLPSVLASQLGVLGGLRWAALLSTFVTGACLYLWAGLLGGRTAGLLATTLALALAPITFLPRSLSFYPPMTALLMVGAVCVTHGLLRRDARGMLWAGAGLALVLLVDVRGLVWAGLWGVGCLGWILAGQNRRLALGALALPLLLSLPLGPMAYPEDAAPLERQMDARPLYHHSGSSDPSHAPPWDSGGAFVWGRSTPLDWGKTVGFLWRQSQLEPPEGFPPKSTRFAAEHRIKPLTPLWPAALLLAVGVLGRTRRRALCVLLISVAPFGLAFWGQLSLAEIFQRFLAQLLPGLCVLAAVPLGILLEAVPAVMRRPRIQRRLVPLAAGGICLLLIHGVGSTPLSVHASWRRPWTAVGTVFRFHPDSPALSLQGGEAACLAEITRDAVRGRWLPVSPDRRYR
jgi:hypothetical protein